MSDERSERNAKVADSRVPSNQKILDAIQEIKMSVGLMQQRVSRNEKRLDEGDGRLRHLEERDSALAESINHLAVVMEQKENAILRKLAGANIAIIITCVSLIGNLLYEIMKR